MVGLGIGGLVAAQTLERVLNACEAFGKWTGAVSCVRLCRCHCWFFFFAVRQVVCWLLVGIVIGVACSLLAVSTLGTCLISTLGTWCSGVVCMVSEGFVWF